MAYKTQLLNKFKNQTVKKIDKALKLSESMLHLQKLNDVSSDTTNDELNHILSQDLILSDDSYNPQKTRHLESYLD